MRFHNENPLPPGEVAAKPTERAQTEKAAKAATRSRALIKRAPSTATRSPSPDGGGFWVERIEMKVIELGRFKSESEAVPLEF
jgi:hypothetical protein